MQIIRHDWPKKMSPLFLLLIITFTLVGCAKPQIAYQVDSPPACQKSPQAVTYGNFPLHPFQPLPLQVLEDKIRNQPFDILQAKATAHGSTSAVQFDIQFRDCTVIKAKWRSSPRGARRYNNDPRREIASYRFQKLFLEPADYVVPVTAAVCIPIADLARIGLNLEPQNAEVNCIFGPIAVWLKNVKIVANFLARDRFERSATGQESRDYARAYANLNIFTYLIRHSDGRKGNFLVSTVPGQTHIFSIDNSLAYEGIGNPRPFIPQWHKLKVDKLPRETVERLRRITPDQLSRELGVVYEFSLNEDGSVTHKTPFFANLNPTQGLRRRGKIVQIGLTDREIGKIAKRLRRLLERIDKGEIQLF